jgi:hypothetical protein
MKISSNIVLIILTAFSFISCNKEVSTSPPESLPQNSGKLFVNSKPAGAKIYLNNKNTGYLSPDTIPFLDGGTYKLTTKLNLFKDSSEIVVIKKDSLTSIFLDYTVNPTMKGALYIDSNPLGASIILNDSATGKVTPFEFSNVLPDTYNVVLNKTGYWDWHFSALVRTDRTTRIYGSLVDTSLFVNYTMSNSNIPSDYINGVVIDQNGNKWIVDPINLTEFDGQNWVSYNSENSAYPGGNANSIAAFGNEIWIATSNGLVIYNNGDFEIIDSRSGLPSDYVYCGLKVDDNSMWVGTNLGLCYFNGTSWTVYNTNNSGLPMNNVSSIKIDALNNKWIGTLGGGVAKFDDTNWTVYDSQNSGLPASNKVTEIEIIDGTTIWASFNSMGKTALGGTAVYDGSGWTAFQSVPSSDVIGAAVQNQNLIWFGNIDNGLSKYENGSWHTFLTSNSHIPSNSVFGISIDGNNYKWIATYGGGLSKYKGN